MTMDYKITHKLVNLNNTTLLNEHNDHYLSIRSHAFKLKERSDRRDIARNHLRIRVVSLWNGLPNRIVNLSSLVLFKQASHSVEFSPPVKFDRNL